MQPARDTQPFSLALLLDHRLEVRPAADRSDLPAIEQLEQALATFDGTLLLVTHDRRLLETVELTRVVDVLDGQVQERR